MKITLKEAYAKSSPPPLHTEDGGHINGGRQFVVGQDGVTVAECQHDGTHEPKIHAATLAHAYGALPEALEVLERAELSTTQIRLAADIGRKSAKTKVQWYEKQLEQLGKEIRVAINKASTVEIP